MRDTRGDGEMLSRYCTQILNCHKQMGMLNAQAFSQRFARSSLNNSWPTGATIMRSDDRTEAPSIENRPMATPPRARETDAPVAKQMTAAEQRDADNKKFFDDERKKANERTREMEAAQSEMKSASAANLKLWIVEPMNADDAPFMYSNTPGRMVVLAPSERLARHVVFVAEGEDWRDENKVKVSEMKISGPTIITRDFRG
jgi:hypothetical protein